MKKIFLLKDHQEQRKIIKIKKIANGKISCLINCIENKLKTDISLTLMRKAPKKTL